MGNDIKIMIGTVIAAIGILGGGIFFLGNSGQITQKTTPTQTASLVLENSFSRGGKDAPVTIVEFADFQCPACGVAYPIVKQIIAKYPEDVRFVYRQFPLPSHKYGMLAAQAAEAAGAQGKFWDMYDKLFENQTTWSSSTNPTELFITYAKEIGVANIDIFTQELSEGKYKEKINKDQSDGIVLQVISTPTFFINGKPVVGAISYEAFKKAIEEAKNK